MIKGNDQVMNALGDSLSKEIYVERIKYSNGNNAAIENIINTEEYGKSFLDFMNLNREAMCIFGAGTWGKEIAETWGWKYNFLAFIDNNKSLYGKKINGIPVLPLQDVLHKDRVPAIVIATRLYWEEIYKQLKEQSIDLDKVFNVGKIQTVLANKQYFDLPDIVWDNGEIFVDVGALDGNTSLNFCKYCTSSIGKIYMFEPDNDNIQKCKKTFENKDVPYEIIDKGLWSRNKTCEFYSYGNGASYILEDGNNAKDVESTKIDVVRLDEQVERVTFIKMDIEGAETEALHGSEKIIRREHPKLAISIYHKKEDIDVIPRLILKYYPGYKLFLRHYSVARTETVLYAI